MEAYVLIYVLICLTSGGPGRDSQGAKASGGKMPRSVFKHFKVLLSDPSDHSSSPFRENRRDVECGDEGVWEL